MKSLSMSFLAALMVCVVTVPVVVGCSKQDAERVSWTTTLQGTGGQVTGGSVGFTPAPPLPTPWPVATEQLEKGNARRVAAQVSEQARQDLALTYEDVLPPIAAPVAPVQATPQGGRSSSGTGGAAWYNGFLP